LAVDPPLSLAPESQTVILSILMFLMA